MQSNREFEDYETAKESKLITDKMAADRSGVYRIIQDYCNTHEINLAHKLLIDLLEEDTHFVKEHEKKLQIIFSRFHLVETSKARRIEFSCAEEHWDLLISTLETLKKDCENNSNKKIILMKYLDELSLKMFNYFSNKQTSDYSEIAYEYLTLIRDFKKNVMREINPNKVDPSSLLLADSSDSDDDDDAKNSVKPIFQKTSDRSSLLLADSSDSDDDDNAKNSVKPISQKTSDPNFALGRLAAFSSDRKSNADSGNLTSSLKKLSSLIEDDKYTFYRPIIKKIQTEVDKRRNTDENKNILLKSYVNSCHAIITNTDKTKTNSLINTHTDNIQKLVNHDNTWTQPRNGDLKSPCSPAFFQKTKLHEDKYGKLVSYGLILLGALTIGASIGFMIATHFVGTPISLKGISFGINLIAMGAGLSSLTAGFVLSQVELDSYNDPLLRLRNRF
jgi:hypothetical protein